MGSVPYFFTFNPSLARRISAIPGPISATSEPILKRYRCGGISEMRCNQGSVLLRWVPSSPPAPPMDSHSGDRLARRWEA